MFETWILSSKLLHTILLFDLIFDCLDIAFLILQGYPPLEVIFIQSFHHFYLLPFSFSFKFGKDLSSCC